MRSALLRLQVRNATPKVNDPTSNGFAGIGSANLPAAAARANKLLSFDANGNPVAIAASAGTATALQLLLGASSGAGLVGWLRSAVGAVTTTIAKWLGWQPPSVFDFMTDV